jgi:hypothetical protein
MIDPSEVRKTTSDAATTSHNGEPMESSFLERAFRSNNAYLLGVAVAAIASFSLYFFGSRLASVKDDELHRFQTESARTIAEANARAAEANTRAAQATRGTAEALASAGAANERAGKLELEAANQRERAAKAEKNLLELTRAVAPRHVTQAQRDTLRVALSGARPTTPIRVMVFIGTEDGIPFSLEFIDALNEAGWPAEHVGQTTMGGQVRWSGTVGERREECAPIRADSTRSAQASRIGQRRPRRPRPAGRTGDHPDCT